jgi:3'-5' exoribonuclease 1
MEIIEIGAVRLDAALTIVDELDSFVRPVVEPKLSQFCTALTTIKQAEVDGADMFPAVSPGSSGGSAAGPYRLCSWGFFDVGSFRLDCTHTPTEHSQVFLVVNVRRRRRRRHREG